MIDKIFDLGETAVREVMVPLVDVAALPETASRADVVRLIQERGFSRIPVFTDKVFNIVGVVTAMDLLRRGNEAADLRALMRPASYVPETKHIDDLLREMQKNRVQLAVVVDEYGGAVGIVTVEDIVEEVVGEIRDEHDRTPDTVERLADGSYQVAGRARLEELTMAAVVSSAPRRFHRILQTTRTDAVAELHISVLVDVLFDAVPVIRVVANRLAVGADRQ